MSHFQTAGMCEGWIGWEQIAAVLDLQLVKICPKIRHRKSLVIQVMPKDVLRTKALFFQPWLNTVGVGGQSSRYITSNGGEVNSGKNNRTRRECACFISVSPVVGKAVGKENYSKDAKARLTFVRLIEAGHYIIPVWILQHCFYAKY